MGKKMKLPSLCNVKNNNNVQQWLPSCYQPTTLSFRADTSNTLFATIDEPPQSGGDDNLPLETFIQGLRSDRLFFEPGETSSIMEEAAKRNEEEEHDDENDGFPFKDSALLSMESGDPYVDFRESMEEMFEAEGLKDWEWLEQLLFWYLRVNGKCNHGYIVGAFVDLLVARITSQVSNSESFYTSSSPSYQEEEDGYY